MVIGIIVGVPAPPMRGDTTPGTPPPTYTPMLNFADARNSQYFGAL